MDRRKGSSSGIAIFLFVLGAPGAVDDFSRLVVWVGAQNVPSIVSWLCIVGALALLAYGWWPRPEEGVDAPAWSEEGYLKLLEARQIARDKRYRAAYDLAAPFAGLVAMAIFMSSCSVVILRNTDKFFLATESQPIPAEQQESNGG